MRVAVLGAGITGLYAAYELSKKGHKVILLERQSYIGGSLRCIDVNGTPVEESYHVVFPNQKNTIGLINELGFKNRLKWHVASTGFYADKLYDAATPIDFLKYKPLSRVDRIKTMSAILRLRSIKSYQDYENITARDWVLANAGEHVYTNFFKPMLTSKFAHRVDEISSTWFISRMALRNNRKWKGEVIGYVDGSFQLVLDELVNRIKANDGDIVINADIKALKKHENKITQVRYTTTNIKPQVEKTLDVDAVISTIPPEELDWLANIDSTKLPYQGLVCGLFSLKKKVTPHFWVNIMNPNISIKYLVELTSLTKVGEKNLVYLGNYQPNDSELFERSENELFSVFFEDLRKLFPHIKQEDVDFWHIGKIKNVCIVNTCEANKMLKEASFKTSVANLYAVGVFNCWPDTNVDLSIWKVNELLECL